MTRARSLKSFSTIPQQVLWRIWEFALIAVMAVAAIIRLPSSWTVLGDNALMAMWTDAVGSRYTPLVGGDARFGWNHLGPWLFYLLAVPYRLLGASTVGLLVGAAVINIVSLLMTVRCVRSVAGGRAAAIVAAGAVLFLLTATGDRLIDPWNPYVVQMPFLLALVSCWAVINGRWRWLAWLIGAGSLCVQSHIAFLIPVFVLFSAAAVAAIRAKGPAVRTAVRRAAIVAVVAWLPPLIDVFIPGGHNPYRIARFFIKPAPSATGGPIAGLRVVLRETGLGASWLGGHLGLRLFTDGFDGGLGPLPGLGLVLLGAAGFIAWRRRDFVLGSLVAILACLLPVAIVEMALGSGQLFPYLFGWVTLVGMMCWATAFVAFQPRRGMFSAKLFVAAGAVALAGCEVAAGFGAALPLSPRERPSDARIVRTLVAEAEPGLSRAATYGIHHGDDAFSSIYEMGVVHLLRHHGYRIVVGPQGRVLFGRHMINSHWPDYPSLSVIAPYESSDPANRVLALSDPLSPAERADEARLVNELVTTYQRAGSQSAADIVRFADGKLVLFAGWVHPDPALQSSLQQLALYRERGRSVAVIIRDPAQAPGTSSFRRGRDHHRGPRIIAPHSAAAGLGRTVPQSPLWHLP